VGQTVFVNIVDKALVRRLEHEIPTGKIDLFDRSVETSTRAEQLRYL
jgi:hypothetical protein